MEVPLDLLRTLAVVVDEGTLDRAARVLRVTPSAVSQRIRAIESHVGRVVLARTKPVSPTPDGELLVRLARQLRLLEHETRTALGAEDGQRMRVPLGVNADSLSTWFLPALAAVSDAHPVTFELHREDQARTARLLETGTVMAAVTAHAAPVAGCVTSPLGRMRYLAAASGAFAARWFPHGLDAASLAAAPVVDFDRDDDLQRRFLASHGVTTSPPQHIISASAEFAHAVELGLGWGMLPIGQLEAALEGTVVALGGAPIDVPLHWQRWNLGSPLLDAVTDAVIRAARDSRAIV